MDSFKNRFRRVLQQDHKNNNINYISTSDENRLNEQLAKHNFNSKSKAHDVEEYKYNNGEWNLFSTGQLYLLKKLYENNKYFLFLFNGKNENEVFNFMKFPILYDRISPQKYICMYRKDDADRFSLYVFSNNIEADNMRKKIHEMYKSRNENSYEPNIALSSASATNDTTPQQSNKGYASKLPTNTNFYENMRYDYNEDEFYETIDENIFKNNNKSNIASSSATATNETTQQKSKKGFAPKLPININSFENQNFEYINENEIYATIDENFYKNNNKSNIASSSATATNETTQQKSNKGYASNLPLNINSYENQRYDYNEDELYATIDENFYKNNNKSNTASSSATATNETNKYNEIYATIDKTQLSHVLNDTNNNERTDLIPTQNPNIKPPLPKTAPSQIKKQISKNETSMNTKKGSILSRPTVPPPPVPLQKQSSNHEKTNETSKNTNGYSKPPPPPPPPIENLFSSTDKSKTKAQTLSFEQSLIQKKNELKSSSTPTPTPTPPARKKKNISNLGKKNETSKNSNKDSPQSSAPPSTFSPTPSQTNNIYQNSVTPATPPPPPPPPPPSPHHTPQNFSSSTDNSKTKQQILDFEKSLKQKKKELKSPNLNKVNSKEIKSEEIKSKENSNTSLQYQLLQAINLRRQFIKDSSSGNEGSDQNEF